MNDITTGQLLYKVIRGERPWAILADVGINIVIGVSTVKVSYSGSAMVTPDAIDIANGMKVYRERPIDCRIWASILIAGAGFIDLGGLEGKPAGELLLEGLWDAASTGKITPRVSAAVDRLVG